MEKTNLPEVSLAPGVAVPAQHNAPPPEERTFIFWGDNVVISIDPKHGETFVNVSDNALYTVSSFTRSTFHKGTITLADPNGQHTTARYTVVSRR